MVKNDKLKEISNIDRKISEFFNSEIDQGKLIILFVQIEKKIRLALDLEDLSTFRNYISYLNIPEIDKKQLVNLRNKTTHDIINPSEIELYTNWLKKVIIPSVLNFQPKTMVESYNLFKDYENKIYNYLCKKIDAKIIRNYHIKLGATVMEADLYLKYRNFNYIIEIKSSLKNMKNGLEQLLSLLIACDSTKGILILPTNIYKIKKIKDVSILLFGIENDFGIMSEWIEKTAL